MKPARPIYKKLLLLAIVIYIAGVTILLVDIYIQVDKIRHSLVHAELCDDHNHKH